MKEEPRHYQDEYRKQRDTSSYLENKKRSEGSRNEMEASQELSRRTYKRGRVGRRQSGVEVISGNPAAVFSDTRGDGARDKSRITGVVRVNREASQLDGAPKNPDPDEIPDEKTAGSETTHEGEQ